MLSNSVSDDNCIVINAINNTVTSQDVAIAAQRFTNESTVRILKYDLEAYSTDKLGFLGCHRKLTIEVKRKNKEEAETINLFVKSLPYECEDQAAFLKESGIQEEEYNFFVNIMPELLENYEGEKFAPTCYLAKPDSLIMEDLRSEGYKLRASFYDCYAEVKSALSALARLHACSILYEAKLTKLAKKPMTLKDKYPNHLKEKVFSKEGKSYAWLTNSINLVCLLGEKFGHDPVKIRQGLNQLHEMVKPSRKHRNVMVHRDLWTNNIMFDDSKPTPKCVLVDYQIISYGPQVLDVLKLLYLHTSGEFRKSHESELIRTYQSVVEDTVRRSNLAKDIKVPTLKEVSDAMEDLKLFGAGMACIYVPLVLMDPELQKRLTQNSDGFNNYIFGDRIDVTLDHMKKNELYRERIKEALRELNSICENL